MGRLRTRLAVATSLLVFFIVSSITYVLAVREERALRSGLEENARAFAVLSAGPVRQAYTSHSSTDEQRLWQTISEFSRALPALVRLEILNQRGEVLFTWERGGLGGQGGSSPSTGERKIAPVELTADARMEDGKQIIDIISPSSPDGLRVRYLVSYRFLRDQLRTKIRGLLLIAALSIGIGVGVALLLSTIITAPLGRLARTARAARESELGQLIALEAGDDVQSLAEAFDCVCEELKRNVQNFEKANRELQKVDQLKSEFLANVSHELRTPITSIRGYVDYLLKGKMGVITDAQRRSLDVVERNLMRLEKRVESLLALSKDEIGLGELDVGPFSLAPMVEELLREVELESRGKGLVLELDIPDHLPPVLADRERISEAMENLLGNAIKFTLEGGHIKVRAREVSVDHRPHIQVSVSDTGIGIPAEELPKIFNRFHQTDSSSRRKYSGIGLGLSIVKEIVERHSGRIEVQSKEGKGTTFHLFLPAY